MPERTPELDAAVIKAKPFLVPEAVDGDALCKQIVAASEGTVDEAQACDYLRRLHTELAKFTEVMWNPPSPGLLAKSARKIQMQGREPQLQQLHDFVSKGRNVVIRGEPGIGKTTLMKALGEICEDHIYIRLDEKNDSMEELRLRLHSSRPNLESEFVEDETRGIQMISETYRKVGAVFLVDNANEPEDAAAVQKLANQVQSLTIVVTSRKQSFPEFETISLEPLGRGDAEALVADLDLSPEDREGVVERGKGNPVLILQEAYAVNGEELEDGNRLEAAVSQIREKNPRLLHLIALTPSAIMPIKLLQEVGRMGTDEYEVLDGNAVISRSQARGRFELHDLLRNECKSELDVVSDEETQGIWGEMASFYARWLARGPTFEAISDEFQALLYLLDTVKGSELVVDLALALIGDRLDDPDGYLPSAGLTRFFAERRERLQTAAAEVGGLRAAKLEKNLGLFCHRANEPVAEELVLSARERFEKAKNDEGCAGSTWVLGIIAEDSCYYTEAEKRYREPVQWFEEPAIQAVGHHLIGCALYHQERHDEARVAFEHALTGTEDQDLRSRIDRLLLYVKLATGEAEVAIAGLEQARERNKKLGRPRDVARISRHIGIGYLELDKPDDAEAHLQEAHGDFERLGDLRGLGSTYWGLAIARRKQNRLEEADTFAKKSYAIALPDEDGLAGRVASPIGFARVSEEQGRIAAASGDDKTATTALRRACNAYEAIGHPRHEALAKELGEQRDAPIPPEPAGILFDVADTLAETDAVAYEQIKTELAERLNVKPDRFMAAWVRSRKRASEDARWTTHERIAWVAKQLNVPIDKATVEEFAEKEHELWTSRVSPKPGIEVLKRIRESGIKIALVTNGPSTMLGLPDALGLAPPLIDASVMSSLFGLLKPHKGIYEKALQELGLGAEQCIYVGDGNDRELDGAHEAGLFAVRMCSEEMPAYDAQQSLYWDATVDSLEELAERLGV